LKFTTGAVVEVAAEASGVMAHRLALATAAEAVLPELCGPIGAAIAVVPSAVIAVRTALAFDVQLRWNCVLSDSTTAVGLP